MRYEITHRDTGSHARAGMLYTAHGPVATPIFMPVGTLANVKCVLHEDLRTQVKAQIVLANTYHLFLQPGLEVLRNAGGLHRFCTWQGPMLTDSGGFQIFSLAAQRKLLSRGAYFKSHLDGTPLFLPPERVVNIERIIGADIIMQLDECPPGDCSHDYAAQSLALTLAWQGRCFQQFERTEPLYGFEQALFPIIQGATFHDLREHAAYAACQHEPVGLAIGGLAVGEPTETMYDVLEFLQPLLPEAKPRYLMGVGTPSNLLEAIARGVDMFDCVMPTRNARNGMLFTQRGIINIKNRKWANEHSPIDPEGIADVDHQYTKAYLRHLFHANEALAQQIASIHNLAFYLQLMREARTHIENDTFTPWRLALQPALSDRL